MHAAALTVAEPQAPQLTLQEWAELGEDQPGELVGGRLVEEEVPDWVHETAISWLVEQLRVWARGSDARVAGSGVKYALGPDHGRLPDLSVFLGGRRPPARGAVRIPPDIVVEVVSPTPADARRERVEKVMEYAGFGIRWYWVVDPGLRTFEVLELRQGAYAHVGAASAGVVSDLPGCPGLVLDLDALWAEVDALE